jgi:hypothetical protein
VSALIPCHGCHSELDWHSLAQRWRTAFDLT